MINVIDAPPSDEMRTENETPGRKAYNLLQAELAQEIADTRLRLFKLLKEQEDTGGKDDYTKAVKLIVTDAGKDGVTLADIHIVFADGKALSDVRDKLVVKDKWATSEKAGMTWKLKEIKKITAASSESNSAPAEVTDTETD